MIGAVGANTPAIMATQPYILICYKTRKTNKYCFFNKLHAFAFDGFCFCIKLFYTCPCTYIADVAYL